MPAALRRRHDVAGNQQRRPCNATVLRRRLSVKRPRENFVRRQVVQPTLVMRGVLGGALPSANLAFVLHFDGSTQSHPNARGKRSMSHTTPTIATSIDLVGTFRKHWLRLIVPTVIVFAIALLYAAVR